MLMLHISIALLKTQILLFSRPPGNHHVFSGFYLFSNEQVFSVMSSTATKLSSTKDYGSSFPCYPLSMMMRIFDPAAPTDADGDDASVISAAAAF